MVYTKRIFNFRTHDLTLSRPATAAAREGRLLSTELGRREGDKSSDAV